ncbi:unnamed protein product, partial [Mycena citricolor]
PPLGSDLTKYAHGPIFCTCTPLEISTEDVIDEIRIRLTHRLRMDYAVAMAVTGSECGPRIPVQVLNTITSGQIFARFDYCSFAMCLLCLRHLAKP